MATKQMNVKSDGFNPDTLSVNKNQDSVHFVQSGQGAPTTVTLSSSALFGQTTCTVDPNTTGTNIYPVLATVTDGDYIVSLPPSPKLTKDSGTINVTG
ncbi:hypothetical protein [Geothrix terrae]|uniref:hypothetical protein n=1 Tax=Geothrix terrae TaxID=2922720 RepID=UPI001FACD339|nr:hypothetical protein [Geothrix terrae]